MKIIAIKNLMKTYQTGGAKNEVLKNVCLEAEKGEFVAIMGRSGCGKSTLLNIMGGMDKADGGSYLFHGERVSDFNRRQLAHFRNKNVGFVFQAFHLLPEFNVMDNISLPLGYAGEKAAQRKQRAKQLLEMVGLAGRERDKVFQLSGGERQRVAIARAISNRPEVILADEPTGSLDEENGAKIMQLLKKLNGQGATIVMVTHDKKVAGYADRVIYMENGNIK